MKPLLIAVILGLFANSVWAWGPNCKYEREVERVVDIEGAELLTVIAGAGMLAIEGGEREDIVIKAKLCSEDEDLLAEMDVSSVVSSGSIGVETEFPEKGWGGNKQMTIDLELRVPAKLNLQVADSSGEASVKGVASLNMKDSSGELNIHNIAGDLELVDSSGEMKLSNIGGNAKVTDSSGAMSVENIKGDFVVEADSSGDIDVKNVKNNVLIKRDSSGSIEVQNVGGNFTVQADGSGGIRHSDVAGQVSLPKK